MFGAIGPSITPRVLLLNTPSRLGASSGPLSLWSDIVAAVCAAAHRDSKSELPYATTGSMCIDLLAAFMNTPRGADSQVTGVNGVG